VKIPSTKPRLSGLRRGAPKVHWVQITAGSLGQSRRPQFRGAVDWLAPAIKANNDFVVREYMSALSALLRRVGL
jgi:hypothetical protein